MWRQVWRFRVVVFFGHRDGVVLDNSLVNIFFHVEDGGPNADFRSSGLTWVAVELQETFLIRTDGR